MTSEATTTRRSRRRRALLLLATGSALLSFTAGQFSLALFTDQETVDGTFSSGTIVLDDAKIDALTLTTSNMMPGDTVTGAVVVENDGSAELRYSLSTSSVSEDGTDLHDVLTLTVKTADANIADGACNQFDGSVVLAATVLGDNDAGFGDPTAGDDSGDRVLASLASETLCFQVELPSGTGNPYQGASTTTTFTFDAEQTKNND
jgi:predicted ribosomally synthesized peptide with SipW-like signal peptide